MASPPPPPPGYYMPSAYVPPHRPIGVTILAVLTILGGILIFLAGLVLVALPLLLIPLLTLPLGLGASLVGGIVVLFGLLWIGTGVGLLRLRSWAWWLAVLVMFFSFLASLLSFAFAIIPFLILVYLILVRKHFR